MWRDTSRLYKCPIPYKTITYHLLAYGDDFVIPLFLLYLLVGLLNKSFCFSPIPIYLFIQFLYQYGLMDSYFTKLVIIHYHIYFDVQTFLIWPVGAHQAGSSVFTILCPLPLRSGSPRCPRSMFYFPIPPQEAAFSPSQAPYF